jgi:hypothetical protein
VGVKVILDTSVELVVVSVVPPVAAPNISLVPVVPVDVVPVAVVAVEVDTTVLLVVLSVP